MKKIYLFTSGTSRPATGVRGVDRRSKNKILPGKFGIFYTLILAFLLLSEINATAETYYSQGSDIVNAPVNWNTNTGGGGTSPLDFTGTNTWIIQSGHTMIMSDNWTVGTSGPASVIIEIEGGLTVSFDYLVTITGTLTVNGTLINSGTYVTSSSITATDGIALNGTYMHARNGGYIPAATWADNSNCNITGIVNSAPKIPSSTQSYGNFTWDCPGEVNNFKADLLGNLRTIKGDFNIISTGSTNLEAAGYIVLGQGSAGDLMVNGNFNLSGGKLVMCAGPASRKMTVNGDISITGGAIYISPYDGTGTIDVNGNFACAGSVYFTFNDYPTPATLNVAGNCSITGGTFNMSHLYSGAGYSESIGTLNLAGNFSHTGGTITETSIGSGAIVFNGTGMQTYTSGGTIENTINFTVNNGAYLQMAAPETVVAGEGTFTLQSGAALGVTSPDGITDNASGNIQTSGRVFNSGASYLYNSTVSQTTGTGLTQNTPANLTVNNSTGVTLCAATTISGLLTMTSGTMDLADTDFTVGSLTGSGNITSSTGTTANVTLTVGSDNTSPAAYSGMISDGTVTTVALIKTGTGTLTLSNAANTYTGVTTVTAGELRLNPASTPASFGQIVLNGGTLSTTNIATGTVITSASTLSLNNSSTLTLSSNEHSLKFADSHLITWSGTTLTITGWSGTAASGGTAGKIFAGSDANGLTPAQLAKITFYGYVAGAGILSTGEIVPLTAPMIVISSSDPAVAAGNILQNTTGNIIYMFVNTVSSADAIISGLQITTDGTYSATDLTSLKAWYSADATFNGSDILLSAKATSLGTGTHVFPNWTNQAITAGTPGYIFITADISCDAIVGATISVNAVSTSDVTYIAGDKSGTAYPGGLQSVQDAIPENVISPSATTDDGKSVLSWTNPVNCPGYNEIMIVAKDGSAVNALPSGDGTSYNPSLTYGLGSGFDGGYVIFKGSESPQTVTGLTNGTTYYYTFFTRKGSTWSNGITAYAVAIADTDREYRSASNGNWVDPLTWEIFDGLAWVATTSAPDFNNNQITIQNGHTVTVGSSVTVDQVVVESGGQVTINNVALTIADGTGNDFVVYGTVELTGNSGVVTTTGNLTFNNESTYIHNRNGGTIPIATWDDNSDCKITGITNVSPIIPSATQSYGNFIWDCPGEVYKFRADLHGNLRTIKGDFNIISTGSFGSLEDDGYIVLGQGSAGDLMVNGNLNLTGGKLSMCAGSASRNMTINGDLTVSGGAIYISPFDGTGTIDVDGNLTCEGSGLVFFTFNDFPTTATVNVAGNCIITGGTFNMSHLYSGAGYSESIGTLNLAGNFSHTGGTITETSIGSGAIIFNGTGMQTYTSGGTIENTVNFTVNNGAYLQMAAPETVVAGEGTFTLQSGAALGVTSPDGITDNASGNIQTSGRVFNSGASYLYNGIVSQTTGTGLTQNTPANLTINNSTGVTLSAATTISGLLTMTSGTMDLADTDFTVGSLTGSGNITSSTGTTANVTLTVGSDNTSPAAYSGMISDGTVTTVALTKTGAGTLTLSNAANTYTGVTTVTAGELRLNPASTPASFGQIVLNGGTLSTTNIATGTVISSSSTLSLNNSSTLTLGSNEHSLKFADSHLLTWSGTTFTITGWSGTTGSGGTVGKIFAGSDANGLTPAQLAKITFYGYVAGAGILSTGEIVPLTAPILNTSEITSITNTTASGGGIIASDGGSPITARGVCWSTSQNPTIDLITKTTDGTGTGSYESLITGLTPGTTYHVRAYAANSNEVGYGEDIIFATGEHFSPIWWPGNGLDHMNLYALSATLDGTALQPGDEIGVFDGDVCVGAGVLTEEITGTNYLPCNVSIDDPSTPEKDGYTTGNTITFKVWDTSSDIEGGYVQAEYISGDGIFTPGATSTFNLTALYMVDQQINLLTNWNILSFAVQPVNTSMMAIVDPLINTGVLIKVQNEQGNAIEELPDPIGWINNIGQMSVTEGYKIKVSENSLLTITGQPILLPYDILFEAGWNIMGAPMLNSTDALELFDPLITAGSLIKVQDEQGNAIERLPDPIGWIDNIHTIEPGKGYKVKTNVSTTLTINTTGKKTSENVRSLVSQPCHFKPVYTGNGLDHMNIYFDKPIDGGIELNTGDEIGVFDGSYCVGTVVVDNPDYEFLNVKVSFNDPTTVETDGFTEGNIFEIKFWDCRTGLEKKAQKLNIFKGYSNLFERQGISVLTADFEVLSNSFLGDAYPNPSNGRTTFTFQIVEDCKVHLEIFNVMGNPINILFNQDMPAGAHKVEWDGRSASGNVVLPGVYFYQIRINGYTQTKQLIIH